VNGKGKDIKNEIYNWLIIFVKCCALEDVALFYPSLFYVLWQTQGNDKWEEHKDNAFYLSFYIIVRHWTSNGSS